MIDYRKELADLIFCKRVLILGFGREGSASLARITQVGGAACVAIADSRELTLPEGIKVNDVYSGESYLNAIDSYDIVFKSPGVVLDREFSDYKAYITSQAELMLRWFGDRIIGITGTKGKSTTTCLIYHELKENGKNTLLMGNIGIPAFDCLDDITEDTTIVFEFSCHQLENCRFSPHIGVYLNLYEEHLDHYGSFEKYRRAKENIYRNMKSDDRLYCGSQVLPKEHVFKLIPCNDITVDSDAALSADSIDMNKSAAACEPDNITIAKSSNDTMIKYAGAQYSVPADDIRLLGIHNMFDISVVYRLCHDLGITDEGFTFALKSFAPLPHRLEYAGEFLGVRYYDDSISTIPATTIQALNTLPETDCILIGGMDRGIDYAPLIEYLATSAVPHIILMYETGARISKECKDYIQAHPAAEGLAGRLHVVANLTEAVLFSRMFARPGHCVVLSPAAASYGYFKNFEERGDVFKRLIMK